MREVTGAAVVFQGAGGKLRQSVCNALILKGTNGLQSRLRRFDSDPSLHEFFQEPE